MESSSRLFPLVSGSMNMVTTSPKAAHRPTAAAPSAAGRPCECMKEGEGEGVQKAADFAHSGGNAMGRGADLYREDLGGIDEGGGIDRGLNSVKK